MLRASLSGIAALALLAACNDTSGPVDTAGDPDLRFGRSSPGVVYTTTNAAGANEVLAFPRSPDGTLSGPTAYATGGDGAGMGLGSQGAVVLSHNGRWLLVVNAGSNDVSVFRAGNRLTPTPFGFAFDRRGRLIVSEAAGGAPGASAVSSYGVKTAGGLETISPSVATTQSAACWVLLTQEGRTAYTTNTASGTVSAFAVGVGGSVALLHAVAANTGAGSTPIDMALSSNGRFVYVLAPGAGGTVRPYSIAPDGSLVGLGPVTGIPATAYGLAAR